MTNTLKKLEWYAEYRDYLYNAFNNIKKTQTIRTDEEMEIFKDLIDDIDDNMKNMIADGELKSRDEVDEFVNKSLLEL